MNFVRFRERSPHSMELLPWLVGWRAVWALLSTSYYVPDETWQSVEVEDQCSYALIDISVPRWHTSLFLEMVISHGSGTRVSGLSSFIQLPYLIFPSFQGLPSYLPSILYLSSCSSFFIWTTSGWLFCYQGDHCS